MLRKTKMRAHGKVDRQNEVSVLKQELPCMDQDLMPIYVQDSRLQAHFNVWSNMFLHLLEQIGYY